MFVFLLSFGFLFSFHFDAQFMLQVRHVSLDDFSILFHAFLQRLKDLLVLDGGALQDVLLLGLHILNRQQDLGSHVVDL